MADGQLKDTRRESVLDVNEEPIALIYAQGFLGAVVGDPDGPVAQLEAIDRDLVVPNPRLIEALGSAFLDHSGRLAMIDRIFGGRVEQVVLNLLRVLSAHGRIGLFRSVVAQVRKLHNASHNRREVTVRVAHPPSDALLSEVTRVIQEKTGFEPVVRVETDPDLLGGVEVRVGDTVYDGTLRTVFAKAHKSMVEQTIQAIETQPERFTIAG